MGRFAYRAIDAEGRPRSGEADAASPEDLERRLRRLGLAMVRCRPAGPWRRLLRRSPATRAELAQFCHQLSQLYRAGIGIIDCLHGLRDNAESFALRQVAASLVASIEAGSSLAEAFASRPDAFDPVFVALVRAGEQSGRLEAALERLANDLRWQDDVLRATRRALAYPALVLVIVAAAIVVLLIHVVPQLGLALRSLSPQLPAQTEFLLAASAGLTRAWPVFAGAAGLVALAALVVAQAGGPWRDRLDRRCLRWPVVGPLRLQLALSRFAGAFALLYRSGIGVLDSLRLCENVVGPRALREALQGAQEAIAGGRSLSQAFADARLFPPLVMRMLEVGESTGNLDDALDHVSAHYEQRAREAVATAQALVGPATTVLLGGVIATILYAIFLPLYDLAGKVRV